MQQVISAMRTIDAQKPPQLPAVELPALPELDSLGPLSESAGTDPTALLEAGERLAADREVIDKAVDQARPLIDACARDLIGLALELGQRALPYAAATIVPIPGLQVAAEAQLTAIVNEFLLRATRRIGQLVTELEEVAAPLLDIAAANAQPITTAEEEKAKAELEQLSATTEETAFIPEAAPAADSEENTAGEAAVAAAKSQLGTPYVWGGTGNDGFDCSGLTQYAWAQAGVDIPRTADQQAVGRQVTADELQAGDLIVWDGHVAMYAGDGTMVEAGDPVQTNPLRTTNLDMNFMGFWRPTG